MSKITKPEELKIGQWYTICCERELTEILTQEDIDDIINMWDDTGVESTDVWASKIEALVELRSKHSTTHPYGIQAIKDIDEMIKEAEDELIAKKKKGSD